MSFLLLLFFGFNVQAQSSLKSYQLKQTELSKPENESLRTYLFDMQAMIFMDDNKPTIYNRNLGDKITKIVIESPKDLAAITSVYQDKLKDVQLIEIVWSNEDSNFELERYLEMMPELNTIFIRSYKDMSNEIVKRNFPTLLDQLNKKEEVEIIFQTMETPQ